MSKAARILVDSILEDALAMVSGEMTVTEFNERLETRVSSFEEETYQYTKEALIDALKSSHVDP